MPLDQAVIDAGAVRFRPMMLTAAAVVVGATVILFDPDLPGPGHLADGRRNRLAAAVAHDRAGAVLHREQEAELSHRAAGLAAMTTRTPAGVTSSRSTPWFRSKGWPIFASG